MAKAGHSTMHLVATTPPAELYRLSTQVLCYKEDYPADAFDQENYGWKPSTGFLRNISARRPLASIRSKVNSAAQAAKSFDWQTTDPPPSAFCMGYAKKISPFSRSRVTSAAIASLFPKSTAKISRPALTSKRISAIRLCSSFSPRIAL